MAAHLFIEQGPRSGTTHALDRALVIVGRDAECTVSLPDTFVSRRQFQIAREEAAGRRSASYFLENLSPSNVTLLNGEEEPARIPLEHDDLIQAGATRLRFRSDPMADASIPEIVGSSWQTARLREQVPKLAAERAPILVRGDPGTGKLLVARAIHAASAHPERPFAIVHAGAPQWPAITPATLYFDEVADLPAEAQKKLRALLDASDVRVIAGTSRDLSGTFDHELGLRLTASKIELSPLCARKDDIPDLARFLLSKLDEALGELSLTDAAVEKLRALPWLENVRELRAVLERAVVLAESAAIEADAIQLDPTTPGELARERVERALRVAKGKHRAAAAALRVSRSRFYEHLTKYGLTSDPEDRRPRA